ncbi:major capsid protein [robinz microvirus RP_178]|nr:major capsid protein [robinz microvirus RP_178]
MKRNKFTLSNYRLFTCDMGQLIPVGLTEALPGDTFQLSSTALVRVSPMAAPVMHPVTVRLHHFFVPHRLVWDGWEDFITGGPDGMDASSPPTETTPAGNGGGAIEGTLWDYLGVHGSATSCALNAMPLYGINKIFNEYYRDQDLVTERLEDDITVPNIAWGKDYFTTARPWTQKGPEVTLPLGTEAPILGLATGVNAASTWTTQPALDVRETGGTAATQYARAYLNTNSPPQTMYIEENAARNAAGQPGWPYVRADLSAAGAININDFRRAFALQRYQEARSRYGSRYTEYLRYLGVTPSDARLQRPEYLGGGTTRLNFSEVLQTAQDEPVGDRDSFGVGDLYGHGVAGVRHRRIRRFIEEHGYIHSFMSVRPKGIYMQGINRTFLKTTKEDFWQKELQHIGQQAVYEGEILLPTGGGAAMTNTFGFSDRYDEYRNTPSYVAGEFRNTLDYWHMARDLTGPIALNEEFVTCVPTKRVLNVQTTDALWCMVNNHVVARRMVSREASNSIL